MQHAGQNMSSVWSGVCGFEREVCCLEREAWSRKLSWRIAFLFIICVIISSVICTQIGWADDSPNRVLVVYNENWPDEDGNGISDSEDVANYYAQKRSIPSENLLGLNARTSTYYGNSTSEWAAFFSEIVDPIKTKLSSLGLDSIYYIVPCYGIPLEVYLPDSYYPQYFTGYRAIDNCLVDILNLSEDFNQNSVVDYNPYYEPAPTVGSDKGHFNHDPENDRLGNNLYLVCRLDGLDKQHVLWQIDRALYGEKYIGASQGQLDGFGYVDTRYGEYTAEELADYPYGYGGGDPYHNADKDMAKAKDFILESPYSLKWQATGKEIGESGALFTDGSDAEFAPEALWYGGWYNYKQYHDVWEWLPGAVACDLNSNSASRLRNPWHSTRSFISWGLQCGLTCGSGVTREPYLEGHQQPDKIIYYILNGFNFAEASALSMPWLRWRMMNIGDPIYNPNKDKPLYIDSTDPVVGEISDCAGEPAEVRAVIHVKIDSGDEPEVARFSVNYGPTVDYGSPEDGAAYYATNGAIYLNNLQPNSAYHYKVVAADPAGNTGESIDRILTTAGSSDFARLYQEDTSPDANYIACDLDVIADGADADVTDKDIANGARAGFYNNQTYRILVKLGDLIPESPPGLTISRARLYLHQFSGNGNGHTLSLYPIQKEWAGDQGTWNRYSDGNSWEIPGAEGSTDIDYGSGVQISLDAETNVWRVFDITDIAIAWINGAPQNNGVLIKMDDESSGSVVFHWDKYGYDYQALLRPMLLIEYEPVVDDHGDDASSATSISLNTDVCGDIDYGGDIDFFKFYAIAGKQYTMETSLYSLPDSYMYLFDTDGATIIAEDDNGGQGYASKITWTCTSSGYYYVEVSAFETFQTGDYTLRVTQAQQVPAMTPVGFLVTALFVLVVGAVRLRERGAGSRGESEKGSR